MVGMLEFASGNIHHFIFPLNVVPIRIKVVDFCLDFLPLTVGSMEPESGANTDLEISRKGGRASELQDKLFTFLTASTS